MMEKPLREEHALVVGIAEEHKLVSIKDTGRLARSLLGKVTDSITNIDAAYHICELSARSSQAGKTHAAY